LQLRTDRRVHVPYGLQGGRDDTSSMNRLCRDGEVRELPAKCRLTIRRDDVFQHVLGGAGGWSDPAERDLSRVAHDVAEGKLSAEHAHREYGVSVDSVTGELLT